MALIVPLIVGHYFSWQQTHYRGERSTIQMMIQVLDEAGSPTCPWGPGWSSDSHFIEISRWLNFVFSETSNPISCYRKSDHNHIYKDDLVSKLKTYWTNTFNVSFVFPPWTVQSQHDRRITGIQSLQCAELDWNTLTTNQDFYRVEDLHNTSGA